MILVLSFALWSVMLGIVAVVTGSVLLMGGAVVVGSLALTVAVVAAVTFKPRDGAAGLPAMPRDIATGKATQLRRRDGGYALGNSIA